MIKYLTHIKDVLGNNYLGMEIERGLLEPCLSDLEEILGDQYEDWTRRQIARDGGKYHITVLSVMEYNKLAKEMGIDKFVAALDPVFKFPIDDLKILGLGRAEKGDNAAFFAVCKSDDIQAVRQRFGLEEKDLHVTLAFKWKDVFGVRKNELFQKESKLISILRQKFNTEKDWGFLADTIGFDMGRRAEIVPVKLTDTMLKVKCDSYLLDIGYDEGSGKLRIYTKYLAEEDMPRLSETEIARILNKN